MNTIQPLSKSIAKGSNYSAWTGTTDFSCLAQGPFYRPMFAHYHFRVKRNILGGPAQGSP